MHTLNGEQFPRNCADVFLVCRVHAVAPLPRSLIEIVPACEGAAGKKVVLDERERTLYTRRAVGITAFMRHEPEPKAFAEGFHLGYGDHRAAGSTQDNDVRVVDHHSGRTATHVLQRIGEKHLAVEALKRRIDLEEQHARIAQHGRSSLRVVLAASDLDLVR
jgi:hypothetical protein